MVETTQFQGIYTESERKDLIFKELKRIRKAFEDLGELKLIAVNRLLNEAAFMSVTLDETRQIISRDGIIETYTNGANQSGQKKSSAVEVYDKMLNSYSKVIAQLTKELPDTEARNNAKSEILDFIARGAMP